MAAKSVCPTRPAAQNTTGEKELCGSANRDNALLALNQSISSTRSSTTRVRVEWAAVLGTIESWTNKGTPRTHSSVAGATARRVAKTSLLHLFLLAVLFTITSTSHAQGSYITGQVITSAGKPAAFATVRVCPYSGGGNPCTPLASLFSDPALTQSLPNPYTTDSFGNFSVATAAGYYIVQVVPTPGTTFSYIYSAPAGGGATGLTSVGLSMPNIFTVANSPLTANGTLGVTLATQTAGRVFAGPCTGSAVIPTFRALCATDLPAGTGTVTSVGLTAPSSVFTVGNSPITASGNIALGFQVQAANTALMGPASGSPATPTFRQPTYADISGTPTLYYQTLTFNTTAATQAATANFSNLFTFSNASGITNIGLNVTGSQTSLVTAGSSGSAGNCVQWNGLGGVSDSGSPCGSGSSSGTVTNFTAGSANPLFTTGVATSTTTPALSFSLNNAGSYTVWGNNTNATGAPGYVSINTLMLPFSYTGNTTLLATASGGFVSGDSFIADVNGNIVDAGSPPSLGPRILPVTCSTSCAFSAAGYTGFSSTLTQSFTSSTLTSAVTGQYYTFTFTQDATGGRNCTYPSGTVAASPCYTVANGHTKQSFFYNGSDLISAGAAQYY